MDIFLGGKISFLLTLFYLEMRSIRRVHLFDRRAADGGGSGGGAEGQNPEGGLYQQDHVKWGNIVVVNLIINHNLNTVGSPHNIIVPCYISTYTKREC